MTRRHDDATAFLDWIDGDRTGPPPSELCRLVTDLELIGAQVRRDQVLESAPAGRVTRHAMFCDDLNQWSQGASVKGLTAARTSQFEISGSSFFSTDRFGAAARVRGSHPFELPGTGVEHRGASSSEPASASSAARPLQAVSLFAAVLLLVGAIGLPILRDVFARITVNRVAEVVSSGEGAAVLKSGHWVLLEPGDRVGPGAPVRTGRDRLVMRLADDSIVRMDTFSYGSLSLESAVPEIEIGDGRVYVEVNSSGAVSVLVDGVVIRSHGPGSSYSVAADGLVIVTEGRASATDGNGRETGIPQGQSYRGGALVPAPADDEWIDWNRSGARGTRGDEYGS